MNKCIDVHSHMVPHSFPEIPGSAGNISWPSIAHATCGHADISLSGRFFRTVEQAAWDAGCRIAAFQEMQLRQQVISPMPELLSYWLPPRPACQLLRHVNGQVAAMVAAAPDRLVGMGVVPLQDVDLAIAEMGYAIERLGLTGIEIGSNVDGVSLADPKFEPFFAAAEDMGVPIFVHAIRAAGKERLVGPPMLEQIVAFPGETGLAIGALIASGTLARHPNLRIAFSHGGGSLVAVLARMQHFWNVLPRFADTLTESPIATAGRLFYDTAVFDPKLLRHIADSLGVSQIVIGTDFPFGGYERSPAQLLARSGLSAAEISLISERNPLRYLGLEEEGAR